MSDTNSSRRRPWRMLILGMIVFIVGMLALAMWSEREDAQRLPEAEMRGVEEGFEGPL